MSERRGSGKWREAGVPHRGWVCVGIEDVGSSAEVCEMCETQEIKFVHIMEHGSYPTPLRCGCVCAGAMEGDYAIAKRREGELRKRLTSRERWMRRPWRVSAKGNPYFNKDGFNAVVYQTGAVWRALLSVNNNTVDGQPIRHFSPRYYASMDDAKAALYDALAIYKRLGPDAALWDQRVAHALCEFDVAA